MASFSSQPPAPAPPSQKMDDEDDTFKSSNRRSKGLSRLARRVMSKVVRSSPKKSDRQISKDGDAGLSRTNSAAIVNNTSTIGPCQLSSVVPDQFDHYTAAVSTTTRTPHANTLVRDQRDIMNLCYYWRNIDRSKADAILANRPDGTFLLRDSGHEDFLYSVSYRRNRVTLHVRIEQRKHKFKLFDYGTYYHQDESVSSCSYNTISELLGHYKDPSMWFEPVLTVHLPRTNPPSLKELARSVICTHTTYDSIDILILPHAIQRYLKEYHYKQRVYDRYRQMNSRQMNSTTDEQYDR